MKGDPRRYYRALRENTVGDIVEASFYELRVETPAELVRMFRENSLAA